MCEDTQYDPRLEQKNTLDVSKRQERIIELLQVRAAVAGTRELSDKIDRALVAELGL